LLFGKKSKQTKMKATSKSAEKKEGAVDNLEDLTRCPICYEQYQRECDDIELCSDDRSEVQSSKSGGFYPLQRIPRILGCEHTFCQVCLTQNAKTRALRSGNEILCPYRCEKVTKGKVDGLMINQTALHIIDHLK